MSERAEDLTRAADALDRAAQQQEGLALAGKLFRKIGSFEQSAQEAEARATKANEEADRLEAGLAGMKSRIKESEDTVAKILADAQSKARDMAAVAKLGAAAAVKEAEQHVEVLRAKATADAATAKQSADAVLSKVRDEVKQATKELVDLKVHREATAEELKTLEAKIATAREAIALALS